MMLQFKKMVNVDVEIVHIKAAAMDQSQSLFQPKSAVFDFKGWWAYEVDTNDSNYKTR